MLRVSSNYVATISIFTGFLFFILVTGMTGDLYGIAGLHWKAYCFWALSGIIHFALGRTWAYRSLQLLGSNRSNIVTSLSPIATVALAMLILKETVTPLQARRYHLYPIGAYSYAHEGADLDRRLSP